MDASALVSHVSRLTGMSPAEAARVVDEIAAHFGRETVDELVRRRHKELQRAGLRNPEAFAAIRAELARRPVAAPPLSERQIRRLIYG